MSVQIVPIDVLRRLIRLFGGTGIGLVGVADAAACLESGDFGSLPAWSLRFQRLYRYHDFCTLELAELTEDQGRSVVHLLVEIRLQEALSVAYRIAGLAVDTADPKNKKINELPKAVVQEEFDLVDGNLLVLFWAFASERERRAFIREYCANCAPGAETLTLLYDATPEAVLDSTGDQASALEDLARELEPSGGMFGRPIYPPLHPAAEYHRVAADGPEETVRRLE